MANDFLSQFEEEYTQIKSLVKEAKDAELARDYKSAKNKYLDAASYTLELSKSLQGVESVTFRNIARMLVDTARDIQILQSMEREPLPRVPGMSGPSPTDNEPLLERKQLLKLEDREVKKEGDPELLQLLMIKTSGIPIFSWVSDKLSENTASKINDILFSGAITAVNNLISEVLSTPIQSINFEEGNILLKFVEDLIFVLYCEGDHNLLEDNLQGFSKIIINDILPKWEKDLRKGLNLSDNTEIINELLTYFKV
ncbi:MAG: hypothetical protein ACXAE3_05980 [Candidatus Kariarchaeaceae archaeon]|jgi:hypothetical protein